MSSVISRPHPLTLEQRTAVAARFFHRRRTGRCQRTLRIGSPGSWKSGATEVEACQWWLNPFERRGLLVIDPHGDTVQSLARRFWAAGRDKLFVLDELSSTSRVPGYKLFGDVDGDGFAGEMRVHDEVMRQVEMAADERGHLERVNLHPFVRQWLYWPIRAVIREAASLTKLLRTYDILSDESRRIVAECGDPAVQRAFDDLRALPRMEIERQVGAARRLMESYVTANVRERCGDWDWCEFHDNGGAVLIDASGLAQEAMRPFCLSIVLRSILGARARRTPLLIQIDEANRGFTSSYMLADQIEQISKYFIGTSFCCQAPDFAKELAKRFWQSFGRTEVFQSSAEVMKDLLHHLWPLVDFHREHHRDVNWHQFHDGFEEIEKERESQSIAKTKHGGEHPKIIETITTSKSHETILVPKFREFKTEKISYWNTQDQLVEAAQMVMAQRPGSRLVLERGEAWFEMVPWLVSAFPSCVERTYERRFQDFLCEMRERPYFRTPRAEEQPINIGAACRLQTIQAGLNGSRNGSNGTAHQR